MNRGDPTLQDLVLTYFIVFKACVEFFIEMWVKMVTKGHIIKERGGAAQGVVPRKRWCRARGGAMQEVVPHKRQFNLMRC